jgi:hypothetical protein
MAQASHCGNVKNAKHEKGQSIFTSSCLNTLIPCSQNSFLWISFSFTLPLLLGYKHAWREKLNSRVENRTTGAVEERTKRM